MAEFLITDESLTSVEGKVVIVTGGSSGIGLSTVQLLLSLGASVVGADLHEPLEGAVSSARFTFNQADVSKWQDLVGLFKKAIQLHGRVDHVLSNAGVGPRTNYINGIELDENGDPKEPTSLVPDVNLKGAINTATLAIHYIRKNPSGGSIVVTSSATGLHRFRGVDYTVSKHGTIGLIRGLHTALAAQDIPVRINGLVPHWTASGIVQEELFKELGIYTQPASAVARAAVKLFADESRRGQLIHVDHGVYKEVDETLLQVYETFQHEESTGGDEGIALLAARLNWFTDAK
ncbi:putative 15-hydroxyprostaglandin dehydrogenase [Xylaria bambusicola]|uniref:putative 15-hydroxyprostaglandin dehydrogenase n=1 Tax=Xylaria bambusicola TaxID=326684 RepID=UPI00200752F6|nr:putative 15-hydroxyprostaglandin dehydrogenase [Xylaria bambusicola]KAI0517751.1 putative 15-hydroxyprostaglandin dehydrogenase [Xylaria bambusicola]